MTVQRLLPSQVESRDQKIQLCEVEAMIIRAASRNPPWMVHWTHLTPQANTGNDGPSLYAACRRCLVTECNKSAQHPCCPTYAINGHAVGSHQATLHTHRARERSRQQLGHGLIVYLAPPLPSPFNESKVPLLGLTCQHEGKLAVRVWDPTTTTTWALPN